MKENNTEAKKNQEDALARIPWLEKFDKMAGKPDDAAEPDIDFLTRIHELEGR